MAFRKQGADVHQQIKVVQEPKEEKITASISEIVCPHCGQTIGQKTGDVYAILDKRFVKIAGQTCPKCGKML